MYLFLVITAGFVLTVGDIILKQWVVKSYSLYYIIGIFLYLISMNLLAHSYKYQNIAIASLAMVIFNVITLALVGYFFFHENFSIYQIAGLIMGLSAIFLMEMQRV